MPVTRRGLVQSSVAIGILADPALARAALTMADGRPWPSVRVGNTSQLKAGKPVSFNYPDPHSPAWLLRLSAPAYGGVGPGSDIVAFSAICTHMGCPVALEGERFVCPCHKSMFDPGKNGQIYQGLASDYLPQVTLRVDAKDDIYAEAMSGLVWGRAHNVMTMSKG